MLARIFGGTTLALALLAGLCWHKWDVWKDKFDVLSDEAGVVLVAVRDASDNPDLKWRDTARQVAELDKSLTEWKDTASDQTARIDELGRNSERLRRENAALRVKIDAANARRDAAIARLENEALDPGDRADCWAQIRAADDALNQLYKEGF